MIIILIIAILILSFVLIKSADNVIMAIKRLSHNSRKGVFAISAVILAIGTSLPEMFVGVTSALEGAPALSLGDVTGSNIANISLVAGFAALLAGRVRVQRGFLRRDVVSALVAGVLPIILMLDGSISRTEGLLLLVIYLGYASSFFRGRYGEIAKEHKRQNGVYKLVRRLNHIDSRRRKEIMRFVGGLVVMLLSAFAIVKIAVALGTLMGVPSFLIGLLVIAVGTSLPEFAFSLRSIEDHEPTMFFGNLLGSTIANSTLVIGVVALIHPITVVSTDKYFTAAAAFVIIFLTFWAFIRSKHRLDRWEAAILVILYFLFVFVEIT
ncbi:sodium:calcium antiporter [Patescibacteria group bacterium]